MPTEKTQDQRGAERPEREDGEEKPLHPPANVPIHSAGEREDAPAGEVESWGSEGGAGCYAGGPIVSNTKIPSGRSGRKPA